MCPYSTANCKLLVRGDKLIQETQESAYKLRHRRPEQRERSTEQFASLFLGNRHTII